ncbi:hypothetical protein E2C01_037916 [Portunus trituberculatus]|uniref:Uncharacterized protein n=1 Tax=Portunus trituberculatus TaxID=210409 RepID=A0A5B7FFE2_PORTR|nr:hypothetical protein [Portunus trituberculatus]
MCSCGISETSPPASPSVAGDQGEEQQDVERLRCFASLSSPWQVMTVVKAELKMFLEVVLPFDVNSLVRGTTFENFEALPRIM